MESQPGSAPLFPRQRSATKATFASGCRGEIENPALRCATEYTPEFPLRKASGTLQKQRLSRVSGMRSADVASTFRLRTICPPDSLSPKAYDFGDVSPRLHLGVSFLQGETTLSISQANRSVREFRDCCRPCLNEKLGAQLRHPRARHPNRNILNAKASPYLLVIPSSRGGGARDLELGLP